MADAARAQPALGEGFDLPVIDPRVSPPGFCRVLGRVAGDAGTAASGHFRRTGSGTVAGAGREARKEKRRPQHAGAAL